MYKNLQIVGNSFQSVSGGDYITDRTQTKYTISLFTAVTLQSIETHLVTEHVVEHAEVYAPL